jgi:hypothetical protein
VRRALADRGFACLAEFRLASGRRADLLGVDDASAVVIVEVKSCLADFRADHKWTDYLEWCDSFYFAVDTEFPVDTLPAGCGLMVADAWGAVVLREGPVTRLAPPRRRHLILRMALAGSRRLHRLEDPMFSRDVQR